MLINGIMSLLYLMGLIMIIYRKRWIVGSGPLMVFFTLMLVSKGVNLLRQISVQMLVRNMGSLESSRYLMFFNSASFLINTVLTLAALYQLVRFAKVYKDEHQISLKVQK